jgi:hypothetical protein
MNQQPDIRVGVLTDMNIDRPRRDTRGELELLAIVMLRNGSNNMERKHEDGVAIHG